MKRTLSDFISANNDIFVFPYDNGTYIVEYENNKDLINTVLKNKYGELPLLHENDNDTLSLIQATLLINKYKLDTLWNTTNLVYNPIWNVDGTETTTTEYGEHTTNKEYGERIKNNDYGEKKTNSNFFNFPYDDSVNAYQTNKDDTTQLASSDTFTEESATDSETSLQHTDKVTIERHGNIGVKSTQSMIAEERSIADFSFWNVVIEMVAKEITIPYYESEVVECSWF